MKRTCCDTMMYEVHTPTCRESVPDSPLRPTVAVPKDKVDTTLADRGRQYGDVHEQAAILDRLMGSMAYYQRYWDALDPVKKYALTQIAVKISRILTGDPRQPDSWHDIQGYSRLVTDTDAGIRHG